MVDVTIDCSDSLQESYGGHDLEVLGSGEYLQGTQTNDNETRFAFVARDRQGGETNSFFEVEGSPPLVRLTVVVQRPNFN
jgi:hypothetical protein